MSYTKIMQFDQILRQLSALDIKQTLQFDTIDRMDEFIHDSTSDLTKYFIEQFDRLNNNITELRYEILRLIEVLNDLKREQTRKQDVVQDPYGPLEYYEEEN